jgi:hypothetical protein
MDLSTRALEQNGRGGPIGGGRGHGWRLAAPRMTIFFSIFMAPAVGGVAHGSVNTHPRAERARTAHRQKKEP